MDDSGPQCRNCHVVDCLSCGNNLRIFGIVAMLYCWMYSSFRYFIFFLWVEILVIMMDLNASLFCPNGHPPFVQFLSYLKAHRGTGAAVVFQSSPLDYRIFHGTDGLVDLPLPSYKCSEAIKMCSHCGT